MNFSIKNLLITGAITAGIAIPVTAVNAEIQCPMGWVKKVENSVVVCVAQDQNQNQAQVQTNTQTQNVNQAVSATGGSSTSSSSSSNNTNVTVTNSAPVAAAPQVIYQAPTTVKTLPATGLPEAAMALSALVPAGLALKRLGFKKPNSGDSASSIWLEKNSI